MEEVGAQVDSPVSMGHQSFAGRFCESHPMPKKRSIPPFVQQQQKPPGSWNPKQWEWDSTRFVAKPRESAEAPPQEVQQHDATREEHSLINSVSVHLGEGFDDLRLKLGDGSNGEAGSSLNSAEEPVSRPNKRVRSGSPGSASYPMCQVDNCKEDLSHAKDYHRRHKVCEFHSKSTKALVAKQMQRFCQQCSRFHPLTEFDEGKRSCRRRLAGHNRRRRKTQPDLATSGLVIPGNQESTGSNDLGIVNLLAVLAHTEGNAEDKGTNVLSMPDKDQLLQILTKINTLPLPLPENLVAKLPVFGNRGKSIPNQVPSENYAPLNGNTSPSTMDLLAVLSGTPAVCSPNELESPQDRSCLGSDSEKTNSACSDQATCLNLNSGPALEFPCTGGERSSSSEQSPPDDSECDAEERHQNLLLQLFSSSPKDDCPPKLTASQKYFSSDGSNPSEARSPSYSLPVAQKLFQLQTSREALKPMNLCCNVDGDTNSIAIRDTDCNTSLQLFAGSSRGTDTGLPQNRQYQAGYTSSGSDHSPSSMNSDTQDRTGTIIFKLFDKDPSHLPGTLRNQIQNWLLNSPSEMESYIRPGCVVLSIYASMSSSSWEQFDEKLLHFLTSLIRDFNTDFWATGRFLMYTENHLASHVDGKLRIYKTHKSCCSPELLSISPLAVVGGQETSVLLRGRNLKISGTRINCSHTGDYTVRDVSSSCQESGYDLISLCNFRVCTTSSTIFGRCFIEVQNGFRVTSFPVIIADEPICQELRVLEYDIGKGSKLVCDTSACHLQGHGRPKSRAEVLHFLNELGWLFQRIRNSSLLETPYYNISRLKILFIFSVERDFCFLVKCLLDILLEINLGVEGLKGKSLEMLSEIHLLNRAVKRRCRSMVDLLLNYSIMDPGNATRMYFFTPNVIGPGGVTPLHLAACTSRSDAIVDALTSDPQEIGLRCWKTLHDASGFSPHSYAAMSNNHSYNRLVALKLACEEIAHVLVPIGSESEPSSWSGMNGERRPNSVWKSAEKACSKCATTVVRYRRFPASQGLLNRPYINSILAIAALCVCVCLFCRGAPHVGHRVTPFNWENLGYGSI